MTIRLRGMPELWDEWRPSKLNLYENGGGGDGDGESGGGGEGEGSEGDGWGAAGASDGFGQGFGDAAGGPATGPAGGQEGGGYFGSDTAGPSNTGDFFGGPESSNVSNTDFFGPADTGNFFGGPESSNVSNTDFFGPADTGNFFGGPESSNVSNADFFGPSATSDFFGGPESSNVSNTDFFGPEAGPNTFSDPFGDFVGTSPNTFSDPYGDFTGPQTSDPNNSFADLGPPGMVDPSGRSAMPDLNVNPDITSRGVMDPLDLIGPKDGGYPSALGGPLGRGPESPFLAPGIEFNPLQVDPDLNPIGPLQNINEPGLNIGIPAPTNLERGINPNDLPGLDPDMGIGKGFLTDPTSEPTGRDARSALEAIAEAIGKGVQAIDLGPVGPAHGKDQSQFMTADQIAAAYQSPNTLQESFDMANQMNAAQAAQNPALAEGLGARGLSTDPEASKGPSPIGLNLDPEAPEKGRTMDEPHTMPDLQDVWGERGPGIDRGRTMDEPHTQPNVLDALKEAMQPAPYVGPEMTNPNLAPAWFTQELQTTPLDLPTAFPTEAPGRTMDAPHNQPSLDDLLTHMLDIQSQQEQGRDPNVQAYELSNPFAPNPYADEPTTPEEFAREAELEQRGRDQELEEQESLAKTIADERGRTMEEPHTVERGPPSIPTPAPNPLTTAERGQRGLQVTVNPARSAQPAPTSRGLTAPSRGTSLSRGTDRGLLGPTPGVQGLPAGLRGNELAQALVSRGFNADLVGAALSINDRGAMLTAMLEAAGLSHAQAQAMAAQARGEVAAQHGLPGASVNSSGQARGR